MGKGPIATIISQIIFLLVDVGVKINLKNYNTHVTNSRVGDTNIKDKNN